jgi:hypothetical protein
MAKQKSNRRGVSRRVRVNLPNPIGSSSRTNDIPTAITYSQSKLATVRDAAHQKYTQQFLGNFFFILMSLVSNDV